MFVRRIYFNKHTEEILLCYMRQGDILRGSVEEDFLASPELEERSIADTGVLEWLEPDVELETQFAAHDGVRLENGRPVFYDLPKSQAEVM